MISLQAARSLLSLEADELAVLTDGWEASADERAVAASALPELMRAKNVASNLEFCGIADELRRVVLDALATLSAASEVVSLAVHLRHRVFESECKTSTWPDVGDRNPALGYLYLIVAASMVPAVRGLHEARGIDEAVTRDTCNQVAGFCGNHQVAHSGEPGILPGQLYWLRHYPAGRLFRVGRFEYMVGEYRHAGPVYRHREHDWTVAFADPNSSYTANGLERCDSDVSDTWTPSLTEENGRVRGNPVDPRGVALRTVIELSADEWERVLSPGDPVLDLHIPAGGGMTPERAKDSFTRSFGFFERYVTSASLQSIVCRSWIFNTQLEKRMPGSNLADLMRQVYLLPSRGSGRDGLFFVFCRNYDRLEDYPRETRMQRALLDVLEAGDKLRSTGMMILRRDVERMGSDPYRGDLRRMIQLGIMPERK